MHTAENEHLIETFGRSEWAYLTNKARRGVF
jgi:hypothetical protein